MLDFACLTIYDIATSPELFPCLTIYENAETCPPGFVPDSCKLAQKHRAFLWRPRIAAPCFFRALYPEMR